MHDDEEDIILDRLKRGVATNHFETVRLRQDGTPIHVSVTISPITDGEGRAVGASTIARDITERKRAEEQRQESAERSLGSEERYALAVDGSQNGLGAEAGSTGRENESQTRHRHLLPRRSKRRWRRST